MLEEEAKKCKEEEERLQRIEDKKQIKKAEFETYKKLRAKYDKF